jgi:hypothetical protein
MHAPPVTGLTRTGRAGQPDLPPYNPKAMATAWIRLEAFESLPGVCVKTGEPTEVRIPVTAEYVPAAFRWLQLFGVWSFVFARSASSRSRPVRIPISRRAFRRYRIWQLSCVAGLVVGVASGLGGSLTTHPVVELIGYGFAALSFAIGVRQHRETWVGINIDRKGREVTVTRCHPAFATAAGRGAAGRGVTGRRRR